MEPRNATRMIKQVAISMLMTAVLFATNARGQDPQFTQFYAAQMYLNPALTGNTDMGRFATIHRKQWGAIPGAYTSKAFAYDHFFRTAKSGAGLMVVTDQAGVADLKFTAVAGSYAYDVNITRKHSIRFGMRAGHVWRNIDPSALTYSDQLETGSIKTIEAFDTSGRNYLDLSFGTVYYNKLFWAGFAFDHLNRPDQALLGADLALLPIKYSAHMGYLIPTNVSPKGDVLRSLRFAMQYKGAQDWDQLDVGMYYKINPLVFGVWYRGIPLLKGYQAGYQNNDAVNLLAGLEIKEFLWLGYSHDFTISRLKGHTNGSNEISLVLEYITKKNQRYKKRNVPCARF